jgi:hypothetical protein
MEQLSGEVAALGAAVAVLIASHPCASELRDALRHIQREAVGEVGLSSQPGYLDGWNRTMGMLLAEPQQGD